jgi:hypothetical protein
MMWKCQVCAIDVAIQGGFLTKFNSATQRENLKYQKNQGLEVVLLKMCQVENPMTNC